MSDTTRTDIDRYDPNQPEIKGIQCPACNSHNTIFIGSGGYLTCSWIECPEPALDDAITLAVNRAKLSVIEKFKDWADKTEVAYNDMMSEQIKPLTEAKQWT